MLNSMGTIINLEPNDEETYNALQSLKVFVEQIDPHNSILPSFNFEL
jgi:hypothetical protein